VPFGSRGFFFFFFCPVDNSGIMIKFLIGPVEVEPS